MEILEKRLYLLYEFLVLAMFYGSKSEHISYEAIQSFSNRKVICFSVYLIRFMPEIRIRQSFINFKQTMQLCALCICCPTLFCSCEFIPFGNLHPSSPSTTYLNFLSNINKLVHTYFSSQLFSFFPSLNFDIGHQGRFPTQRTETRTK